MAITLDNIKQFKEYFEGVMGRAEHHADGVNEIILALVGGIVWKSNGNFRVREYDGLQQICCGLKQKRMFTASNTIMMKTASKYSKVLQKVQ